MTARYMDNYALRNLVPRTPVLGGDYGGRVRNSYDQIATTTAMTTADTIAVGELLPGERFLGGEVLFVAHGSGRTVKIGDAGDDDRYLAATSIAAAGNAELRKIDGFGYRNDTAVPIPILATLAGGTLAADAKGLVVHFRTCRD